MKNSIKNSLKVIIDTSTLFSAIYNRLGNEAQLFRLADEGKCEIYLLQYVLDELQEVFKRKEINFNKVYDLLDTYRNITIWELKNIKKGEIELANEIITDPQDRPIFIFCYRMIRKDLEVYFVTGDKAFFKDKVKKLLNSRVLTTLEFLKMI